MQTSSDGHPSDVGERAANSPGVSPAGAATVLSRREVQVSPWVRLIEKKVRFDVGQPPAVYHCLAQADYIGVFAITEDGTVPIVRQFRPAVEEYTWEFPAGLLEAGEEPAEACRRELLEEAAVRAEELTYLGAYFPDTGRLENRLHAYFARTSRPLPDAPREEGIATRFVTLTELAHLIRSGEFRHQMHIALIGLASLWGLVDVSAIEDPEP